MREALSPREGSERASRALAAKVDEPPEHWGDEDDISPVAQPKDVRLEIAPNGL